MAIISGCATFTDPRQLLIFRSQPPGAHVLTLQGELLGITPLTKELSRQKSLSLLVRTENETQKLELKGHYRWDRSFAGNLAFLTLAPAGWVTDFFSGAAWEFPVEQEVSFQGSSARPRKKSSSASSSGVVRVLIAPPRSIHPDISDELGPQIEERLKSLHLPHHEILHYQNFLPLFESLEIDGTAPLTLMQTLRLAKAAGVEQIYVSELDTSEKIAHVHGFLKDPTQETEEKLDFDLPSQQISSLSEFGWIGKKSNFASLLPNSTFIDFGQTRSSFRVNNVSSDATASAASDGLGNVTQYLSAISLRKMIPPSSRENWRFSFDWVPTASFSRAQEIVEGFPGAENDHFIRLHLDAGYGANIAYGSNQWSFYASPFLLLGYNKISTDSTGSYIQSDSTDLTVASSLERCTFSAVAG